MSDIKTWYRRLRFKLKHDVLVVDNVVLILAIVLCLVWTYQSIVAMSRNWELSEEITARRRDLELIEMEVEAAELENEYYKTEEYQEIIARKFLDKEGYGENMVILPENSEEAKNKHSETVAEVKERQYSNFEKWMMYLFPKY